MLGDIIMILLNSGLDSDLAIIMVNLGIILLTGYLFGRGFEYFKIPSVTGYLVAGLVLGPITGYLDSADLGHFAIISDIALGFIAFQVGNELWFGKLKKSGTKIIVITIIQAVLTTAVVVAATSLVVDISVALMLGAIAAATAPAPIMLIIKKYRAKGDLTDTIIPVVGLDDAVGVVMFSILLSISIGLLSVEGLNLSVFEMIKEPGIELLLSIGLGGAIGFAAGLTIRHIFKDKDREEKNLNIINITVLMTTGTALLFGASPILTPMIAGTVVTNLINKECYILEEETIRFFIPPLMLVFFTVAGAQLDFVVVMTAGAAGLLYIVARIFGKFFGAYIGSAIMKTSSNVKKYLGVSLLPQSGVAIGLSVAAYREFAGVNLLMAEEIKNVVLASVLFFALTGPILVKIALQLAGDIKPEVVEGKEKELEWTSSKALS
jgi:Kef-type K+ transport system membrane component KefB